MQFHVPLKQYSDLIHFQYDQADACLRPTELKPKLDRYLRAKLNLNKEDRMRYQLRVRAEGDRLIDGKDPYRGLYFGNMGSVKHKKSVLYRKGATLTVNTYFDRKLADHIRETLPLCLALENFGTRQNKGFGSFYIDDKDFPGIEETLKKSGHPVYYFNCRGLDDAFQSIKILYKAMKSGINETSFRDKNPKAYLKSLLWRYFNDPLDMEKRIIWEKRFLKQALDGCIVKNALYIRALLGMAEEFSFKEGPARRDLDYGDSGKQEILHRTQFTVSHPQIKRFKSPVTFKPVDNRVYIILDPAAYQNNGQKIHGTAFTFEGPRGSHELKVPEADQFDLNAFMQFVMETVNKNDFGNFQGKSANRLKQMKIFALT